MLEIKNLSLKIKDKEILNDITFKLKENKTTVLIGKNGSGKSSIIKAINGLVKYDGLITLNDVNILDYKPKERAKKIAILPQHLDVVDITVYDLVKMGRNPYLGPFNKLNDLDILKVEEAIKLFELNDLKYRSLTTLSGGEVQKAYLALLIASNADIYIFDEPTTFLDIEFENYFLDKLKQYQNNKTILLVLHNITKAIEIADEVIILDKGMIVFNDSKEKLLESKIIEKTFNVLKYQINDKVFYTK